MRHLIDPMDLSVEDIDRLLDRADDIAKNPEKYQEVCKHKKLATLFFEPSTRTRLSFEAAMLELGEVFLDFLLLIHHLHLKEKVLQIQQESLNVMQILLRCVIQRKEHHM